MMQPMDPLHSVVITAREIYDGVVRLTGRVDVLIEQHSALRQDLDQHENRADSRYADHETRMRTLERARWPLPSLAVIVSLGSLATALFVALR